MATATCHSTNDLANARADIPGVSDRLVWWFHVYLRRYFPKHFHSVGVSRAAPLDIPDDMPLVVFANHASWWDPLVALVLSRHLFPDRRLYAPVDAAALRKYPLMKRLGFFPVEQDRLHGAGQFLKTAGVILRQPRSSIWLTPEGRFTDPRDADAPLQPGLAHLAHRLSRGVMLPMAIEYVFWEERLPEVLVRTGAPISLEQRTSLDKQQWHHLLHSSLRETQTALAMDAIKRQGDAFTVILSGRSGVGRVYDTLRAVVALLKGRPPKKSHGGKLQS